jgi:hypothetical protein
MTTKTTPNAARKTARSKTSRSGKAAATPTAARGRKMPQVNAEVRTSKLDRLIALVSAPGGASLADLMAATGWQAHSVRGALAGALRKRGHEVASEKGADGVRRYRTGPAA